MNNLLDDLFFKYHADKTPRIKHHYSDTYYNLFKDRRESVKKVLEIGTAEGASLFAWRDFFPNATIYGGEIEQKRVDMMKGQERMKVFQCDQSSLPDLRYLIANTGHDLDFVIDDGSHIPQHQLFTALAVIPLLDSGSTYIIEDVDNESADAIFNELTLNFPLLDWEMIKVGDRHDDRLIICQK